MFYTYRKVLVIAGIVFCLCSSVFAYSGGSGEPNNPYQIATVSDWNDFMNTRADWNKNFIMTTDLNLQGIELIPIDIFFGVFDGNNHILHNVNINASGQVGLLGSNDGIIRNICLEGVDIKAYAAEGIVGNVGGIVGNNVGLIENCHVSGIIEGQSSCGGITGTCTDSQISNCSFKGHINGTSSVGSIAGSAESSKFVRCYAIAEIIGEQECGGIVGRNEGSNIESCFAKGTVTGSYYTGGFAGSTGGHCGFGGEIHNCYADVTVNCSNSAGGFAGWGSGQIWNCYSSGKVIYDVNNHSNVGGFIGGYGTIPTGVSNSYFLENSGPDNGFGEPLSEEQMKQQASFIGWDFSYTDGDKADWFIQIDEYPILTWQISPADIYTDGRNNFRDFAVFAQYWMREDCAIYNYYCDWADLDFNGSVDIDDLIILMSYWLQSGIYN